MFFVCKQKAAAMPKVWHSMPSNFILYTFLTKLLITITAIPEEKGTVYNILCFYLQYRSFSLAAA